MNLSGCSNFTTMLDREAPGNVHYQLSPTGNSSVLAHRHAPAHEFTNPGTSHLAVMVVPHYQLTQALFDLGSGWRDHFCPEPQPVHVLPPDTAYRWTVNGRSTVVILALPMIEVRTTLEELDVCDPMEKLSLVMDRGFVEPLVYEIVMRLWAHTKADAQCPALLLQSQTTCVLHALVARGSSRRVSSRSCGLGKAQLATAIELIEARLDEDLSLDELAASCSMSRFHFSRMFRQSTGYAPYQYVLRRRIEKARALLISTKDGIAEIGLAVGFVDAGHFSRTFARHIGLSPQRFRAAAR